jgi:hypothetical protein
MNVVNVENTTLLAHERQLAVAPKSTLPYANLSAKVYHIYIVGWVGLWCLNSLSTIFQFIVEVNFIGGESWRKPTTCRKLLTTSFTQSCIEYTSP